ncbi:hypothetical protein ACA910_022110 [Epithemia clementina (nom. ined.)]
MAKNAVYAVLWILLLIFIAWPVAGICCWFWLLLQAFEGLFPFVKKINHFLEKIITWPRECGNAIATCSSRFPEPH